MKYFLYLFLGLPLSLIAQQKGDSVLFIPGRSMRGVGTNDVRSEGWHDEKLAFISSGLPGNTYVIYKVKKGCAYIKVKDIKMNDWTPAIYKLYIDLLLYDSAIVIKPKKD